MTDTPTPPARTPEVCLCAAILCDDGYIVAVLANMDPPAAGRISDFIVNRLPAKH